MADAPKILGTDSLKQTYPKLNSAIDNSNEAFKKSATAETNSTSAVNTANAANAKSDSTQTQLNAVVNRETDSDAMSAQAAVDANGVNKGNLKQRLDDDYNEVTTKLAQTSTNSSIAYVEKFPLQIPETDDTARIQRAIDSLPNGGRIVLGGKTYNITGINLPSNIVFEGVGTSATILYNNSVNDAIAISGTAGSEKKHILIRDLTIKGNNIDSGHGINAKYATNLVILNHVDVIYNNKGFVASNSWTIRADKCRFQWNRDNGIDIRNNTNNAVFRDCLINFNFGHGFYTYGNDSVALIECDVEGNRKHGVFGEGGNVFSIEGGYYEQNGQLNDATNKYSDIEIGSATYPCKFVSVRYVYINSKLAEYAIHVVGVTVMETRRNDIVQAVSGTTTKGIYIEATNIDRFSSEYDNLGTNMTFTDLSGKGQRITYDSNGKRTKNSSGNVIEQLDRGSDTKLLSQRFLSNGAARASIDLEVTSNDLVFGRYQGAVGSETYKEYGRFKQTGAIFKLPIGIELVPVSETLALNNTLFVHSSDGKLKFKDGSGVVNPLY
ncbi:right-handed parallel beta-helix repeat-containing protein [Neobacillus sp. MM2021_6]|uniref:right-handed parallel beta-helix repeat-containing protein n=1 Tax=Bacillaceae TaxID=186817 RepID=UPI00140D5B97|nr:MULTISPECIES: right-handed parallel beta-helix repeat-containing protein [Bacillaceae]MBO0961438.1 right-handed parallel beta-helix repeat-containing protein [Neobacillus sp. MM2021_6]NHC19543.1 right-handed parallel beta-helix repeat-containing protein [Bacillus sp. MM2020_4]